MWSKPMLDQPTMDINKPGKSASGTAKSIHDEFGKEDTIPSLFDQKKKSIIAAPQSSSKESLECNESNCEMPHAESDDVSKTSIKHMDYIFTAKSSKMTNDVVLRDNEEGRGGNIPGTHVFPNLDSDERSQRCAKRRGSAELLLEAGPKRGMKKHEGWP